MNQGFQQDSTVSNESASPFDTKRKKKEVDCIFNFDSVFCRRKKPYLKPLNTLSAEISIDITKADFCPKIMGFFSRSQNQLVYSNFCYITELSLVKKYKKKIIYYWLQSLLLTLLKRDYMKFFKSLHLFFLQKNGC